ncbi:peptidase [Mycolicibacterium moriokaense]|nr:peptidase [Mycolicibacterium moriokaense]
MSDRTSWRRLATLATALAAGTVALSSCSATIAGEATSPLYDPYRVAGIMATDGPSGVRDDAPEPVGTVLNTDGSDADDVALLAVNDVEEFWSQAYAELPGTFDPITKLASYDSKDPDSPTICGSRTYRRPNAFFCYPHKLMAWDRGALVPTGQKYFGDTAIAGLIAHEYGHAIQDMAGLMDRDTPTIVLEQQADCFGGSYLRWLAEDNSERFTMSTGDGLNHILAAVIVSRDPVLTPDLDHLVEHGHGTALDRVSAVQIGFIDGVSACADISLSDIQYRRGELPMLLPDDAQTGDVDIDEALLDDLVESLDDVFKLTDPPTLDYSAGPCPGYDTLPGPAVYCPTTNTINIDLPALSKLGQPLDESKKQLLQGDNTALSIVVARYSQAVQHHRDLELRSASAALRTACYTGVAERSLAEPTPSTVDTTFQLTAGDLDEAVSGLLTNGLVASDVTGATVPAGFTRILAFRTGLSSGNLNLCDTRFA